MRFFSDDKKPKLLSIILVLSLALTACGHIEQGIAQPPKIAPSVLIDNVHIIDVVNQRIIRNQQVVIKAGLIAEIRPARTPIKDKSLLIKQADGAFLMPGLIDMHIHAYEKNAFELSLSHGVTHVRVMNGTPQHLSWRDQQKSGDWLASGMTVSSPIIRSGQKQPISWLANNAEEARALVQQAKQSGYDLIKAYGSLSKESLLAIQDEATKLSLPIAKHGPHPADGMSWQALTTMQSLEHVEDIYQGPLNYQFDEQKLTLAIEKLARVNTPVTPTLNTFWQLTQISQEKEKFINALPENYISAIIAWEDRSNQVARWLNSSTKMAEHNQKTLAFLMTMPLKLAKKNIPILVGSDAGVLLSPHGLATHNEMRLLELSGLSAFSVLQAATITPAKALNKDHEIGQVKVGFNADLILIKHDPTSDLSHLDNPIAVIKNGHWLTQKKLLQLRNHASSQQSWWAEFWLLLTNY